LEVNVRSHSSVMTARPAVRSAGEIVGDNDECQLQTVKQPCGYPRSFWLKGVYNKPELLQIMNEWSRRCQTSYGD
jgi:hypothetical protein